MTSKEDNILIFGNYPQTIKAENVKIDKSEIHKINIWNCFKGNDNNFYIEETVTNPNNIVKNIINLSNGKKAKLGEKLYFKVEPIKWDILGTNNNRNILLSTKVLDCYPFDKHFDGTEIIKRKINNKTIMPSNYEYSNVRAFLNSLNGESYDEYNYSGNGFIDKAFTKKEQEQLITIAINNSVSSLEDSAKDFLDSYLYNFDNTYDKVFLPSLNQIEKFDKNYMIKYATDYALIKGVLTVFGKNNSCNWWLCSPSWSEMYGIDKVETACVDTEGSFELGFHVDFYNGIVPAICMDK